MSEADAIIARLGLSPHPEGGHYAETFRDAAEGVGRGACTVIHFLLKAGERSHWHRVDAAEIWAWHAGGPLKLRIDGTELILGGDVLAGQVPHAVVPAHSWQAAEPLGEWALVSCVVAPAFSFDGFEMAPPGWEP
ncbi:MAG: cupin domain-containing protein [Alphaproteobacteria bacterium]|nr:cupin domain-containing protein [Alphaproteobacteria bacterium]